MEYQAIIGIKIPDLDAMDYCREPLTATSDEEARLLAEDAIRHAMQPPKGDLFLRRLEVWSTADQPARSVEGCEVNDNGECRCNTRLQYKAYIYEGGWESVEEFDDMVGTKFEEVIGRWFTTIRNRLYFADD